MKKILQTVVVLSMLAGIGTALNWVTLDRIDQGCIQLADFYNLKEHTVDLLCIGSSHVYYSINTCQIYDDYGITAYLLASPGQPVWLSYYFLEEALKTQSPKIIIYDVCTTFRTETDFGQPSLPALISMKPSAVKWKAIGAMNQEEEVLDKIGAFFSFPYYHTRYSQLTRQDFVNTEQVRYNGYHADFTVITENELAKWQDTGWKNIDQAEPVTERTEFYLRKLIELCQSRKIPLFLVNAPFINHTEKKQKAYNYINLIAQEYGIPFIDANNYIEEMQMDFSKDLIEASHLNYYGSEKYTDFLIRTLKADDQLPDRRGNKDYQHWEETSDKFRHRELLGKSLQKISTVSGYRRAAENLQDCVAVIYQIPDGDIVVYEDGEVIFMGKAGQEYFHHFDLGSSDLTVSGNDGTVQVELDGKTYLYVENGINVIVYDKIAKRVIDGVGFDAKEHFQAVRMRSQD